MRRGGTVTGAVSLVMIFVVLAMAMGSASFFPQSSRPVSPSTKAAAWAWRLSGPAVSSPSSIDDSVRTMLSEKEDGKTAPYT